jgi:aryl-phospho-beta-D-glucosidase BglC (GH1 family)
MENLHLGRGLNVGTWLFWEPLTEERLRRFFTEDDVKQIADWGFRHIRIPFDYALLESDAQPGIYHEDGFRWFDLALEWAEQADLQVVLDMHRAPGFFFMDAEGNGDFTPKLISDPLYRQRFMALWQAIARRYKGRYPGVAFEPVNEIIASSHDDWNEFLAEIIAAIRQVDATRTIVVGSNQWNSCWTFAHLRYFNDPHLIYTFHFYDPILFTHQRASWEIRSHFLQRTVPYPGRPEGLHAEVDRARREGFPLVAEQLAELATRYDTISESRETLSAALEPVLAFQRHTQAAIYCGEFGVYDAAPREDTHRWFADMLSIFDENHIVWANWQYKGPDFALVDAQSRMCDEKLLKIFQNSNV